MQFIDLKAQQRRIKEDLDRRMAAVLEHGMYVMGPEVRELEAKLAQQGGARHALSCANGTDALALSLMALGVKPGDAVFVPSFTFAATAEAPANVGATPIFVDIDDATFDMDPASLERAVVFARKQGLLPAGVIAVDLFGLPADYDALRAICDANEMWLVADAAQSFGATYKGAKVGALGDLTTTSFFPAKPLGCYGDGGAVFTDNDEFAALIDSYRVHGKGHDKYDNQRIGVNSRLDTLQAAVLLAKLEVFDDEIVKRQQVAERYARGLEDLVTTPITPSDRSSVWAQYSIQLGEGQYRRQLLDALKAQGVPTAIYYPIPLHRQTAFRHFPTDPLGLLASERLAARVLALPMHPYLEPADQDRIIDAVRRGLGAPASVSENEFA